MFAAAKISIILKDSNNSKKRIYVLDSLKHPSEVNFLREIYGKSFWLIGVSTEKNKRIKNLQAFRKISEEEAVTLIKRDEDENLEHRQKMTDTYECADYFLNESSPSLEVDRLLNIVFGNTKFSPKRDEQYMHIAASIASQSSDLSRQVGAVVVSENSELIGIGCNDVPKFPGGQYKEGDKPDFRDLTIGHDPNHKRRDQILENIPKDTDNTIKDKIKNLTEYHRAVHAEMEAIISCARKGISTLRATLYTTTYPCHNCAKHILNAGVIKIVYIQAYSKSLAIDLHNDAISEELFDNSKMTLNRYTGIGPRKYLDYFSLTLSPPGFKRKGEGVTNPWETSIFDSYGANPKYPISLLSVNDAEIKIMKALLSYEIISTSNEFYGKISA